MTPEEYRKQPVMLNQFDKAQGTEDSHFAKWGLPAREYIVCGFEAENFEQLVTVALNKALIYSGFWLEKHGLTMDVYSPEVYYNSSPEGTYMELWMPTSERCL